ncbi:MAG: low molecular weight protein-tyrosine-phosphatase [Geminicoccaceae bacterium]
MQSVPSILFVCTGNICRSPLAEALLRQEAAAAGVAVEVDSAGISDEERGNPPDPRARAIARARGLVLPDRRARRIRPEDFRRFDLILAMTRGHLRALEGQAPPDGRARLRLFLDYAPELGRQDLPDPWYGGMADFALAMDMIEAGITGLLADMTQAGRAWPGPAQEVS